MSFVFEQPAAVSRIDKRVTPGVATDFLENLAATGEAVVAGQNPTSRGRNLGEAFDPIIAALNEDLPSERQFANPYKRSDFDPPAPFANQKRFRAKFAATGDPQGFLEAEIFAALAERRTADSSFGGGLPADAKEMRARITASIRQAEVESEEVGARATLMGQAGSLVGGMGGALQDPMILGSMAVGASAASGVLRTAIIESGLGAGFEALLQPAVADYRKSLGLDYTPGDFVRNVAFAGAGGFLLGGAIKGALTGFPKLIEAAAPSGRKLIESFDRHVKRPTAGQAAARAELERAVDMDEANPLPDTGAGQTEHVARLDEALATADAGTPTQLPDRPAVEPSPPATVAEVDNLEGQIWRFDPDTIGVDAKTFQFKAGGDAFGVTDRLEGIAQWDPVKAGQIVVYEFRDGSRFVVDGHQRVALARRIKAQDPAQNPVLFGQLLREADGVTPEMARVIAAAKNIAEGTGSAIDAAKVMRISPERIGELPLSSGLVRQARGLVNLSDESFGLVVNEVVPAHFAAIVGKLVPDDAGLQRAVLDVLAQTEPANLTQAEAIVRQAIDAGTVRTTQDTLFGTEMVTESLFKERAQVLDATLRRLKGDRSVFASLNRNRARIEAEGNRLDTAANQARETVDAEATQALQTLANRKGPLSDALSAAAARAKAEGRSAAATDDFVAAVRGAVERGDFDGAAVREPGRAVDVASEARSDSDRASPEIEQERLSEFDEPGGKAQEEQAEALEAEIRPADEVEELRQDLLRKIDAGATVDEINAHPAVLNALDEMKKIPDTRDLDGFGTPEFRAARKFDFAGQEVIGYDAAIPRLVAGARAFSTEGPVRAERQAAIVIGPPASGKSLIAENIARKRFAAIADPDEAKRTLPEFKGGVGSNGTHEESSAIAAEVLDALLETGDNLVLPKVGAKAASVRKLIRQLKGEGYTVDLINMAVDPANAYSRMIRRFITTGRIVEPGHALGVADKPLKVYNKLRKEGIADGYANLDNNGPQARGPIAIEDTGVIGGLYRSRGGGGPGARQDVRPSQGPSQEPSQAGQQFLIDGVEPITDADRLAARGGEALRGGDRPLDDGLFDVAGRGQEELLDRVPLAERVDPETGNVVPETRSTVEILDDIEADRDFLEKLELCGRAA